MEFAYEIAEVLWLVSIVQFLDRALRDDATVVGVHDEFVRFAHHRFVHCALLLRFSGVQTQRRLCRIILERRHGSICGLEHICESCAKRTSKRKHVK